MSSRKLIYYKDNLNLEILIANNTPFFLILLFIFFYKKLSRYTYLFYLKKYVL